jgi:hypothetical protein
MGRGTRALAVALALIGAAGLIGCEDTPLTPGEDWTISLVAQPSIVSLSPITGLATSTLIATVLDSKGVPQPGVSVIFSNAGGVLASGSAFVETDDTGRAFDTLTVRAGDPDEIDVTVASGTITDSATVSTAEACSANEAPVARIAGPETQTIVGNGEAAVTIVLDGSLSSDTDGVVTAYTWVCGNGEAPVTSDDPTVTCTYPVGGTSRNFTASLQVSDDGTGRNNTCVQVSPADTITVTVTP